MAANHALAADLAAGQVLVLAVEQVLAVDLAVDQVLALDLAADPLIWQLIKSSQWIRLIIRLWRCSAVGRSCKWV